MSVSIFEVGKDCSSKACPGPGRLFLVSGKREWKMEKVIDYMEKFGSQSSFEPINAGAVHCFHPELELPWPRE